MRWRMVLEVVGVEGVAEMHEIGAGERPPGGHSAATLGLGLEQGKADLAAVQGHLVAAKDEEHRRNRSRCDRCGAQRPLKDPRPRRLTSLFGVAALRHRAKQPRTALAERPTDLGHALSGAVVCDEHAGPDGLQGFVARDEAAGVLREVAQHVEGLGAERQLRAAGAEQAGAAEVEAEALEQQDGPRWCIRHGPVSPKRSGERPERRRNLNITVAFFASGVSVARRRWCMNRLNH